MSDNNTQGAIACGICCLSLVILAGGYWLWTTYPTIAIALLATGVAIGAFAGYRWFQNKQQKSRAEVAKLQAEAEQIRQRTLFEQQQTSSGLVKFVDKYGNEKWGTPYQVQEWQRQAADEERLNSGTLVREKETIIREVVKVRCPYCGGLYDEIAGRCPNCGAKR
jgi:hypothetical protein